MHALFVNMYFQFQSHSSDLFGPDSPPTMSKPSTSASKPPVNDEIDRLLKQEATAVSRDVEVCYPDSLENGVDNEFFR